MQHVRPMRRLRFRRRRAAVRAAGPPGGTEGGYPAIETVTSSDERATEDAPTSTFHGGEGAPADPPDQTTATDPEAPPTAAKKVRTSPPAKKAAAKKSARKTTEPAEQADESAQRAPRKRSAKKAAAAVPARRPRQSATLPETSPRDEPADGSGDRAVTDAAEPAPVDVQASPAAELGASGDSIDVEGQHEQVTIDQEVVPPVTSKMPPTTRLLASRKARKRIPTNRPVPMATSQAAAVAGDRVAAADDVAVMNQTMKMPTSRTTWNCRQATRSSR